MNKVQVAFENVSVVIQNARMTGPEHDQLKLDLILIAERCRVADMLEKEVTPDKDPEDQHPEIPSDPKGESE